VVTDLRETFVVYVLVDSLFLKALSKGKPS